MSILPKLALEYMHLPFMVCLYCSMPSLYYRIGFFAFLMGFVGPATALAQQRAMPERTVPPANQTPPSGAARPNTGQSTVLPVSVPKSGDTVRFALNKDLIDQLIPFEDIYQIALSNSPALRFENAMVDMKASIANYTKVAILQTVSGFASYSRGNQLLIGSGSSSFDFSQNSNGYRTGIGIQLPLSEVVGRRYKIQQSRAEYQGSLAQRDVAKMGLKRELNRVYQALLTSQRTLRIRLRDEQAALMAFRIAEVDVQQGKIDPADYARYSNQYAIAQVVSEKERGEFMTNFRDLEIIVGVPMIQLQISQ